MTISAAGCGRSTLIDAITVFLARGHVPADERIRRSLERVIDQAGEDGIRRMRERLSESGGDWVYYGADPLARRIHHVLAAQVLREPPRLIGGAHLRGLAGRPVVIVANHLSYSDANVIEVALHSNDAEDLAERLVAVAGPKVYTSLQRRFSSLCFGTIKVPQSTERASEEAVMSAREVARAARQAIDIAHDRLAAGDALLLFPEGSRSRSAAMQPWLAAAARYLDDSDVPVLPVGLVGTDRMFPVDGDALGDAVVEVRCGRPIDVRALRSAAAGDRQVMMDALALAVADLLPESSKGVYSGDGPPLAVAKSVLTAVAGLWP